MRDKVYVLTQGARSLFDGSSDPCWGDNIGIDNNWIHCQQRMWFYIEGWAMQRARLKLPIFRLEDIPSPEPRYVELPMYTKSFRRGQLQHSWRERDEPHVRQDLFFLLRYVLYHTSNINLSRRFEECIGTSVVLQPFDRQQYGSALDA